MHYMSGHYTDNLTRTGYRIIVMEDYYTLKEKKKKALIAVCTLGLSQAQWKLFYNSAKDADRGMSFQGSVFGFLFKVIWFVFWTLLTSLIIWIINIFKLIYYSIELSHCN